MSSYKKAFIAAVALTPLSLTSTYAKPSSAQPASVSRYIAFDGYQDAKFGMTTDDFKNALKCSAFLDWTYTPAVASAGQEEDDHTTSVRCDSFSFLDTKVSAIGSFYDDHLTDVYLTNIPGSLAPVVQKLLAAKYGPSDSTTNLYSFKAANGNQIQFSNNNGNYTLLYAQSSRSRAVLNKDIVTRTAEKDV